MLSTFGNFWRFVRTPCTHKITTKNSGVKPQKKVLMKLLKSNSQVFFIDSLTEMLQFFKCFNQNLKFLQRKPTKKLVKLSRAEICVGKFAHPANFASLGSYLVTTRLISAEYIVI